MSLWADNQGYARFSEDGKTLTFLYDGNKQEGDYGVNDAYIKTGYNYEIPAWINDSTSGTVTKVVFDASFTEARPTNCACWFYNMRNLKSIEGLKYLNTSEATDMSMMFAQCSSLTALDLSTFNTDNVTDMSTMFEYCTNLASVNLTSFNTAKVTDMSFMFDACINLTTLNLSSFNTANVNDAMGMFYCCTSLFAIFTGNGFVLDDNCDSEYLFYGCFSLPGYSSADTDAAKANADGGYFEKFDEGSAAWVGYDESTKTLTFHYDAQKASASGSAYGLPTNTTDTPAWLEHKADVEKVVFDRTFSCVYPTSCHEWFNGMTNLSNFDGLAYFNTFNVTDMGSMFAGCTSLAQIDFSSFNTANITDMSSMFDGCTAVTLLDLTSFNTAKVTNMSRMFAGCSSLATIYAGDDFTIGDGCQGDNMFAECNALTKFDTSKTGKDMATFDGYFTKKKTMWVDYQDACKTMTFHYDNNMNATEATYKYKVGTSVFQEWQETCANSVEKVVISKDFADARPTNCNAWFTDMTSLTTIEGMKNLNTSEATSMMGLFWDCKKLTSIDLSHFDTSKVKDMYAMFEGCETLTELDLSKFDTSNVTDMEQMFEGCKALTKLDLSNFNTENVKDMNNMFCSCSGLTTLDLSKFNTSNVTNMMCMFNDCSSLTELDLSNFDTSKVTDMYDLFCGCTNLKVLNLKSFNTSNVTNMWCMFDECSSLTELDLSHFNTSNVTKAVGMFSGMSSLTKLNVSSFDTSKITDMQEMFGDCPKLTELDLSSFDTSASESFLYMFYGDTLLAKIYVSDKFTNTGSYQMFKDCISLPGYNANYMDGTYCNYTNGYLLKKVGTNGDEILGAKGEPLTIDELQLSDDKDFVLYEDCKATKASYSRNMTSTWGTLCLPYAIDTNAEGNNCKFYSLQGVGSECIWLKEIESNNITAGTPVLVCLKDAEQKTISLTASETDVVKEPVIAEDGNYLVGTFSTVVLNSDENADCYFIAKNKFFKVSDYGTEKGVKVNPFRAYIKSNTAQAPALRIDISDDITGIDSAKTIDTLNDAAEYYDINGRRTTGVQKGLNIVRLSNGKTMKVFVK